MSGAWSSPSSLGPAFVAVWTSPLWHVSKQSWGHFWENDCLWITEIWRWCPGKVFLVLCSYGRAGTWILVTLFVCLLCCCSTCVSILSFCYSSPQLPQYSQGTLLYLGRRWVWPAQRLLFPAPQHLQICAQNQGGITGSQAAPSFLLHQAESLHSRESVPLFLVTRGDHFEEWFQFYIMPIDYPSKNLI